VTAERDPPPLAEPRRILARVEGGLAHEIKTPLSTIRLNLELVREDWAADWKESADPRAERSLRRLELVIAQTRHLESFLREFLKFARSERTERVPVEVGALLDEVLNLVEPACAARKIELRREYAPAIVIEADPALMKQALLNLVLNAHDAMPHGGILTVRLAKAERTASLEVLDTGLGMTQEVAARVFGMFYTTKAEGTGLGLATAKRIVEAHGGRIEFETAPGRGTRFIVALPILDPSLARLLAAGPGRMIEGGAGAAGPAFDLGPEEKR
jgi:signal transduction histidine kinase